MARVQFPTLHPGTFNSNRRACSNVLPGLPPPPRNWCRHLEGPRFSSGRGRKGYKQQRIQYHRESMKPANAHPCVAWPPFCIVTGTLQPCSGGKGNTTSPGLPGFGYSVAYFHGNPPVSSICSPPPPHLPTSASL